MRSIEVLTASPPHLNAFKHCFASAALSVSFNSVQLTFFYSLMSVFPSPAVHLSCSGYGPGAEDGHPGCGRQQPQRPNRVVQLLLPWQLLS